MELTGYGKRKIIKILRLGEREIQLLGLSKYEQQKKEIESMYLAGTNVHIIAGKMNVSVRRTQEYIADIRRERLEREEQRCIKADCLVGCEKTEKLNYD